MRWDGFGRQSRWIFPSPTTPGVADPSDHEEYRHDAHGNRIWVRKRDGRVLAFEYDALNRMTVKIAPTPDATVRYAWDNRGLQVSAWFPWNGWTVSHAYDGFGRVESTTSNMGGSSRTVGRAFDRDGRRAQILFPDGARASFTRDGLGRMKEAWQGALADNHLMAAFAYNAAGLTSYFARRSGDATAYGYDPAWRLGSIEDVFPGGSGNTLAAFAYNPAGQLRSESRSNDAYAWSGARLAGDYAVNGLNQYTAAAGLALAYDANGNLTSDGSTTYAYDAENRLVSATGARNATLSYDPLGRLWQVTSAAGTTRFLHDGDELVAEYDGSGALLRRYVHGDGSDDPLFWYEGATLTQPRFPHADRQGSIVAVFGAPAGTAVNTYDEYGIPGAGNVGRFQYTGQAWIPELALYYYKARFYASRLGRFMQTDPIGYEDQINLYAYVGNDPANGTDPDGTSAERQLPDAPTGSHIRDQRVQFASGRGGYGRGRGRYGQTPAGNQQVLIEARIRKLSRELKILDPTASSLMEPSGQRTMTAVHNLERQVETLRMTPFTTNAEARRTAEALGYSQVNARSRGQAVFSNGSNFITRDIPSRTTGTSHNGGVWKMATSVNDLGSRLTRSGTYNRDLTVQIGD